MAVPCFFVGLIVLANDVSTVVAETFALGMVEGECQKWLRLCECPTV